MAKPERKPLFSVTIADCDVQTFCTGGPGGQNQNKREMGVRIIHRASGAIGECREERSQLANKRKAFRRMAESKKMQLWLRLETGRILKDPPIESVVEKQMNPKNIRVEKKTTDNTWEVWEEENAGQ